VLEAGDHAQQRRLAAAARPEERHDLTRCDAQIDGLERFQ
jgi:hypothetical protein